MNRRPRIKGLLPRVTQLLCALLLTASSARVDAQASVAGTVRDQNTGLPLTNVEVRITALERTTRTDSVGRFSFSGLPPGQRVLAVRLLGYRAAAAVIQLIEGETIVSEVTPIPPPATLDTVTVVEQAGVIPSFEEHRRVGLGHFITRAELAEMESRRLGDALARFQGVQIVRGLGPRAWVASGRGPRTLRQRCSEREGASPSDSPRVFGRPDIQTKDCACFAVVYLDDMILYRGTGGIVPDINRFSPAEIESVEYYASAAQTPVKYSRLNSECGVLVIHTRRTP